MAKYNLLKEDLKSQLTSFVPTNIHCRYLREGLKTQPGFTSSTFLIIDFDIFEVISLSIEPSRMGYSLWCRYHHYLGIKDLILAIYRLCKYTWEIVAYMVFTSNGPLRLDIWPETPKQAMSTKDIMRSL